MEEEKKSKKTLVISMIIGGILLSGIGVAGLPPTTLKGMLQTAITTFNFLVPKSQATKVTGGTLIETGNLNLLVNPNMEHSTACSSWTSSVTGGAVATLSVSTSGAYPGEGQYCVLSCSTTVSGTPGTCSLIQNVTTLAGSQGFISALLGSGVGQVADSIDAWTLVGGVRTTNLDFTNTGATFQWREDFNVPEVSTTTSLGIEILITNPASVVQQALIDRATISLGNVAVASPVVTAWQDYTPTFTSFGTVPTQNFRWRQVGQSIEIEGRFTAGTPTATEARLSLPNNFTSVSTYNTLELAGVHIQNGLGAVGFYVTIEPSVQYLTFSFQSAVDQAFTKKNGSNVIATGGLVSLRASVRVSGLSASTQAFTSQCGALCENHLSATSSATGVITGQAPSGWVTGSASIATGSHTVPVTGFTAVPKCGCSRSLSDGECNYIPSASTTTSLLFQTENSAGTSTASAIDFWCDKGTVDYISSRTIIGSFKEVMTAPGVSKPKICYYGFGGAGSTLASPVECTAGTCTEVYDTCGTGTPPSWVATALYNNLIFANGTFAASVPVHCECRAWDATINTSRNCLEYFDTGDQTWASTASGGYVGNFQVLSSGGAESTAYVQVKCEGQAP